jgi:hypothetical protein
MQLLFAQLQLIFGWPFERTGLPIAIKATALAKSGKRALQLLFAQLFSRLRETNPARQSATVKSGMQAKPNKTARERSERGHTGTER